jgi:N-acetyl sugar amidotransferase
MLTYCSRCVMPSTKPDLLLNKKGVCNACINYENRGLVDWDARGKELLNILDRYRSKKGDKWDCIVPVSGGKDSTYQVVKILQLGLNPLCVTSTTCDLSEIGRKNIENIKNLGVDYIEVSPKPNIRARLNRIGLEQVGDISWPEHVGIFTIPVRAAVQFNVPLIIWGENSQNEYGGPAAASDNSLLSRAWLEEFGGLLGMRVSDLINHYGFQSRDLINYTYPTDAQLKEAGVTGLFLGHYMPWDGLSNALIAQANGFICYEKAVEASMVNYENLDNYQTGIHDYFKFLKFGFGRATDLASLHIRRGRITRQDGLDIVRRLDGRFPWQYLGKSLSDILMPLDLTIEEFILIADKFTNKKIFERGLDGNFIKDKYQNLKKIN